MNFYDGFRVLVLSPIICAGLAAIYSYFEFASNGITPPDLWIATFLAAFFIFAIVYFISMTWFVWRFC
jgi:hypothetical protein